MAILNFDINSVEKRENNFELLQPGWYTAQITDSEVLPLNSGNGKALKLTFEVLSDGYRNRKLWTRLNIQHNNPDAERIAKQQLRELCEAAGVSSLPDSNLLHFKPVQVRVKIRKDDTGRYEDQNDISGFKPAVQEGVLRGFLNKLGGSAPSQPAVSPPSTAAPATSQAATPPWLKKSA
jgi:hypothetical protein